MHDRRDDSTIETRGPALIWLGGLVAAHALVALFFNPFANMTNTDSEWIVPCAVGVFFSQPLLFAAWAAIGPPPAAKRIPLTFASIVFVQLLASVAARNPDSLQANPPDALEPEIAAMTFGIFAGSFFLTWIVSRITRLRIVDRVLVDIDAAAANQFSIRFLLGLTAICAALLAAVRGMASAEAWGSLGEWTLAGVGAVLLPVAQVLSVVLPVIIVSLLILSPRPRVRTCVIATLSFVMLSGLGIATLVATGNDPPDDKLWGIVLIVVAAMSAGVASAIVLRLGGHRLMRGDASRA